MLFRQSAVYMVANIAAALIGFASVMTLTRLVQPADYGIYVVVVSIGSIVMTLSFTWLRQSILRFQAEPGVDIRLSALAGYVLTVACYPVALLVAMALFHLPFKTAAAAVLFAAALAFFELGQELQRARQHVRGHAIAAIARSASSFALCLAAMWFGGDGFWLVAALIGGYAIAALVSAPAIWRRPIKPFDAATLGQIARYGLPITLSGLFVAATLTLDRLALASVLGTEAAGIYGATADFVRQCAILPAVSASMAIAPLAVSRLAGASNNATSNDQVLHGLADGGELLLAVMLPTVTGLSIIAPQIAEVMLGPAYRIAAVGLIPIVAVGCLAHIISQQYVQLSYSLARRPGLFVIHTGLIFAINAALMLPLIRRFGLQGAAWSFLISEVSGVLIGLLLARNAYRLPLIPGRLLRICAATAAMAGVTLSLQHLMGRADFTALLVLIFAGGATYVLAALALDVVHCRRVVPMLQVRQVFMPASNNRGLE
jgi:O-antigen/teichoic acid export membrane protein